MFSLPDVRTPPKTEKTDGAQQTLLAADTAPGRSVHRIVPGHLSATLYLGDSLAMLSEISGDVVISEPPYGISHKSSHGASWSGTQIVGDGCTTARDTVSNHFADKPLAMFGISWKMPPPPNVRISLVWDKSAAFGAGDLRIPWKPCWEEIYIGGNGWTGRRDEGVLRGPCEPSWESGPAHDGNGRKHPHQKPVWLMARLIEKLPDARVIVVRKARLRDRALMVK